MSDLQIGTRVKINDHRCVYSGDIDGRFGTVASVNLDDDYPYGVDLDGGDPLYFLPDELMEIDELTLLRAENARLATLHEQAADELARVVSLLQRMSECNPWGDSPDIPVGDYAAYTNAAKKYLDER